MGYVNITVKKKVRVPYEFTARPRVGLISIKSFLRVMEEEEVRKGSVQTIHTV